VNAVERMYQEAPLCKFSGYSVMQIRALQRCRGSVIHELEKLPDAEALLAAHDWFVLWTLAAYEVIRTMDGPRQRGRPCFLGRVESEILSLKGTLERIRMVFAKQEYKRKGKVKDRPVDNDASISGVNIDKKDICFSVESERYSARDWLAEFDGLIGGINAEDILADHRDSYSPITSPAHGGEAGPSPVDRADE